MRPGAKISHSPARSITFDWPNPPPKIECLRSTSPSSSASVTAKAKASGHQNLSRDMPGAVAGGTCDFLASPSPEGEGDDTKCGGGVTGTGFNRLARDPPGQRLLPLHHASHGPPPAASPQGGNYLRNASPAIRRHAISGP